MSRYAASQSVFFFPEREEGGRGSEGASASGRVVAAAARAASISAYATAQSGARASGS